MSSILVPTDVRPTHASALDRFTAPSDTDSPLTPGTTTILCRGTDGKWYTSDTVPATLQVSLRPVTPDDAQRWQAELAKLQPAAAKPQNLFRRSGHEWQLRFGNAAGTVKDSQGTPLDHANVFIYTAAPKEGVGILCPSCYADCRKHSTDD